MIPILAILSENQTINIAVLLLQDLGEISFFAFSRASPMAYGGPQARGQIGAVAADLHHSHSNAGSEPHLQPTPQLTATPDH